MTVPASDTYEDRFARGRRWIERIRRRVRWLRGGRKILVETRWRLGDEIMALPIYSALAAACPGATIGAWCNYPELLEGNAHARPVTPDSFVPDRYILLRSDARSVFRLEHYARLAGVPTPLDNPSIILHDWSLAQAPLPDEPFVVLAPGASWQTKRWPNDRWRALARLIEDAGHRVVVLGTVDEALDVGVDLAGKTLVRDAACLLRRAALAVACDSGLMHLALAVDTPTVALFGPTDPNILVLPNPHLSVITNARECAACWNRSRMMSDPGVCPRRIPECLDTIAVDDVFGVVRRILERH